MEKPLENFGICCFLSLIQCTAGRKQVPTTVHSGVFLSPPQPPISARLSLPPEYAPACSILITVDVFECYMILESLQFLKMLLEPDSDTT